MLTGLRVREVALEHLKHPLSRGNPVIARSGQRPATKYLLPRRSKAHDHDPRHCEERAEARYKIPLTATKQQAADQRTLVLRGASTMVASKYLPPRRSNHSIYHPFTSPHKSFHPGFISSINFIFRAREPPFMRFSSAIASSIVGDFIAASAGSLLAMTGLPRLKGCSSCSSAISRIRRPVSLERLSARSAPPLLLSSFPPREPSFQTNLLLALHFVAAKDFMKQDRARSSQSRGLCIITGSRRLLKDEAFPTHCNDRAPTSFANVAFLPPW
jgi:hypothetical protein